jgi:hypothetical protein
VPASNLNLVVDVAILSDLNALMKTDAPPVMVKPRSGTDLALGWQKTVKKYKYDRLNQPWDDRDMVEVTPPSERMKS